MCFITTNFSSSDGPKFDLGLSVFVGLFRFQDQMSSNGGDKIVPGLVDQVICDNDVNTETFPALEDVHGGVIVDVTDPMDSEVFLNLLRVSLSQWSRQGKKGVWIKLPIGLVNLVEAAVKEGFRYHHAEPNYLMLVHWIPKTDNTIPANASHRVRVGSIVMNSKRELLVVQEKCGRFQGTGIWKIPTGIVEQGEELFMGAVREVKEETGIDTEFVEILGFRQSHRSFFEKSDLFFLCMLHPISFDIQKQDLEIEDAQWMPFEEFKAQPFVKKHELFQCIIDVCTAKIDGNYAGFTPRPITSAFKDPISHFYLNSRDMS